MQQRNYLETHLKAFDPESEDFDAALNPASNIYSGQMLDASRMYAWAYDTRPFPAFPREGSLWSDGENWRTGHWLNGRLGALSLAGLVEAIVKDHALPPMNTSRLTGWLHGYVVQNPQSVRDSLEPLFDLFGASWRPQAPEGFSLDEKATQVRAILDVVGYNKSAEITRVRTSNSLLPTALVLSFADPLSDYQNATVSAFQANAGENNQVQNSLPIVLDGDTASGLANRWLLRARDEAETLRISLAPENADLEVGDFISVATVGLAPFRIDRITYGETQAIEARKAKTYVFAPSGKSLLARNTRSQDISSSGRAIVVALDLPEPVLRNGVVAPVVRIAAYSKPWKRQLVLLAQDQGDVTIGNLARPAIMGELVSGGAANWRGRRSGTSLTIKLYDGALQSVSKTALFSGANSAALRATNGEWEVFQFQSVEEIAANTWRLTGLLRGQLGTKDAMGAGAAPGAPFVLLDSSIVEISMSGSFMTSHELRIGPAGKSLTDTAWQSVTTGALARSVTPLAPEQLRIKKSGSDYLFKWIRCGRFNADDWDAAEIPLGEASESYSIRIINSVGATVRMATVLENEFNYPASQRVADLGASTASFKFSVKQNGSLPGLGLESEILVA